MKKFFNKKGFTLAELLIVIAIIAILIAIAVPVFSSSMKRAQKATDDANFRAAKSAAVSALLSGEIEAYDTSGTLNTIEIKDSNTNHFYYTTDGHFIAQGATLPTGVEYVTAKYTADGSEPNYHPNSGHTKGSKLYIFVETDSIDEASFDGEGYDDYYILSSSFGMVYIGFGG